MSKDFTALPLLNSVTAVRGRESGVLVAHIDHVQWQIMTTYLEYGYFEQHTREVLIRIFPCISCTFTQRFMCQICPYAEMRYGALFYVIHILLNSGHIIIPTYGPTYFVEVKKVYILCRYLQFFS